MPLPRLPTLPLLGLLLAVAGFAGLARANDLRFSSTLESADRAACGLPRLTSDQVAVLDALVRRDLARQGQVPTSSDSAGPESAQAHTFSGRLSPGERETLGLQVLKPDEVTRLDAAVAKFQTARLARSLLAPPTFLARRPDPVVTERRKEREIHGTFSLSYGMGSGGYREKSGSMVLSLEDPAKGYSVSIGYTETHLKGGTPYYLYRDPYLDPLDRPPTLPPRP